MGSRSPAHVAFGLALLLRIAWVIFRWQSAGAAFEFDDERLHWQLATNLIQHGALLSDDGRFVARMPLYPAFLALFAWAGPAGVLFARLAQAVLGAATAGIAARVAGETFGRRAAWAAGLLVAIDPYAFFFSNLLLTEVPFMFVSLVLLANAWNAVAHLKPNKSLARASGWDWSVAGWSAAAIFMRPSAAGWVALLWIALWLMDRDRWRGTLRLMRYALVLAACLAPWGLRNMAVVGDFAWLSANGGVTLYDAQGPQARGDSNQSFLREMPYLAALGEVEQDRLLGRWAVHEMQSDKSRVLRLAWTKFLRTWNPIPNFSEYRGVAVAATSALFTVAVVVMAISGTIRAGRGSRQSPERERAGVATRDRACGKRHSAGIPARLRSGLCLFWLPVVYFTILHCIYIGSLRYRVPLMPFLEIAAAGAFVGATAQRVEKPREVIIPAAE